MPETESAQGGFHADVTLRGSLGEDRRTMRVGLFATHTWVSRATAERLGARTLSAIQAETPSGGTVERTLGELEIEIAGRKATVPVVFGESDDLEAIGRTTLAVLLLEPDLSSSSVSPRPWTHVTHPPLDLEKQDRALSERMKKGKTEANRSHSGSPSPSGHNLDRGFCNSTRTTLTPTFWREKFVSCSTAVRP